MWDLVPQPGIEPGPLALGGQSLSHWTTREIPGQSSLIYIFSTPWDYLQTYNRHRNIFKYFFKKDLKNHETHIKYFNSVTDWPPQIHKLELDKPGQKIIVFLPIPPSPFPQNQSISIKNNYREVYVDILNVNSIISTTGLRSKNHESLQASPH